MKQKYRTLSLIVVSIIITIFSNLNNGGQSFLWVIYAFFLYHILFKVLEIKDKRLIICSTILGVVLASFAVVGGCINDNMSLSGIISSKTAFFVSIIKWCSYIVIISSTIMLLYDQLNKCHNKTEKPANKKSFFIGWGIIFLAWIPYLLQYFPGIATPDSVDQIKQAIGLSALNAHHPLLHTMIIRLAMTIGQTFSNQNTGILIYSIMQMLVMSAIFSFAIYYMAKKQIPEWIRVVATIFFALYPVNAIYSITMWKNILSGGAILLFVICMTEIATTTDFLQSKIKFLMLILVSLTVIYLLNNGIYIIILTIPFLILACRKNYKKILAFLIIILIMNTSINTLLYSVLNIQKGSIREALSIPIQQLARVITYRRNDMSDEDKEKIYNFLPADNLHELYNPTLSDPVKAKFDEQYFKEHKLEFITTWAGLFFEFPVEYIEAFLCNCYGYWYPEASNWVVSRTITEDEKLETSSKPIITGLEKIDSLIDRRDIPVFSMLFSLGFMFWLLLIALTYCIYKKNYNLLLVYVPILILWLTVLASPVFCEYRYLYGMVVSLPILLSVPTLIKEKKEEPNGQNSSVNSMLQ